MPSDQFIKVGKINTRYWVEGDKGEAVILVHGLGGFAENWIKNVGPLSQRYRVYVPDMKGFGRTDKLPLTHDLNELILFLNNFMSVMGIEKASLVGNSLGGGIVLQYAVNYPQKVTKLVLVDNAGMGSDVIADFKFVSIPVLGEIFLRTTRKSIKDLWQKILYNPALITDDLVEQAYQLANLPDAKRSLLAALRAGIGTGGQRAKLFKPLLQSAGKLNVPTLIVWGKNDRIIPPAHAEIAVKTIPGAQLKLFEKCGHMPMYEYPAEFNELVINFIG